MPGRLASILPLLLAAACASPDRDAPTDAAAWTPLFDGTSLDGWTVTEFGGQGDVAVRDGAIFVDWGGPLTGVTYTGADLPTTDYEIALEATRKDGNDFFCGLTFPVGDSHCSLILGGWGGTVCGLSCIDGLDASENDTTTYHAFEDDRPYRVRVRVSPERIQAWLDDERIVDQDTAGKEIYLRPEVDLSAPLGIAAFSTIAEYRAIRIR